MHNAIYALSMFLTQENRYNCYYYRPITFAANFIFDQCKMNYTYEVNFCWYRYAENCIIIAYEQWLLLYWIINWAVMGVSLWFNKFSICSLSESLIFKQKFEHYFCCCYTSSSLAISFTMWSLIVMIVMPIDRILIIK